jgi:DNA polymerase I-like protein with 3'-5' exonuclease and polymerase domains
MALPIKLQNVPNNTELGHRIRRAFFQRASADNLLNMADYSKIEQSMLRQVRSDNGTSEFSTRD